MKVLSQAILVSGALMVASGFATASTIDLTSGAGSSGTSNGGIFEWTNFSTTGSGNIDPFLRIGPAIGGNPDTPGIDTSAGYNTEGTVEFQTKDDGFTSSLALSTVPIVDRSGTDYYQFLLDINEEGGSKSGLSLDDLEIYLLSAPNLTGYPFASTPVYTLGAADVVQMDASLNSGSGKGDVFILIPTNLFTGPNTWVYLYAKFGVTTGAGDGFEEFSILCTPTVENPNCEGSSDSDGTDSETPVPEPGSLILLGSGLVYAASRLRPKKGR